MRRGKTAVVFHKCNDMGDLLGWFVDFLSVLRKKTVDQTDPRDPTLPKTTAVIASHLVLCKEKLKQVSSCCHVGRTEEWAVMS